MDATQTGGTSITTRQETRLWLRFRALKVWLDLQAVGRAGHARAVTRDMLNARRLFELAGRHDSLEPVTLGLSIATLRFVPPDLRGRTAARPYLNRLNREIVECLQRGGVIYPSHTDVRGEYVIRFCFVNHRTRIADIDGVLPAVVQVGRMVDSEFRAVYLHEPLV